MGGGGGGASWSTTTQQITPLDTDCLEWEDICNFRSSSFGKNNAHFLGVNLNNKRMLVNEYYRAALNSYPMELVMQISLAFKV